MARPRLVKPQEPPKSFGIGEIVAGAPGTEGVTMLEVMAWLERKIVEEAQAVERLLNHPDPKVRSQATGASRALNVGTTYFQSAALWFKEAQSFDLP